MMVLQPYMPQLRMSNNSFECVCQLQHPGINGRLRYDRLHMDLGCAKLGAVI